MFGFFTVQVGACHPVGLSDIWLQQLNKGVSGLPVTHYRSFPRSYYAIMGSFFYSGINRHGGLLYFFLLHGNIILQSR